ncbi:DUF1799 domain-containing protein [Nitratireductor soli]|uniref:DUF1799 domain-containing protein n=1 Tax=Nitratireductor soli TaxID=1670619 RepID=UPI000B0D5E13|nr:DUF1799 domain-containing protein [Nitratireductor soli]
MGGADGAGAAGEWREAADDARRWGMDEPDIAALVAALSGRRSAGFAGVWPDNCPAVDAFLAAASQWRTALVVEGGRLRMMWIGLDYAGAAVAWKAGGRMIDAAVFAGVQAIELAARAAMNGEV